MNNAADKGCGSSHQPRMECDRRAAAAMEEPQFEADDVDADDDDVDAGALMMPACRAFVSFINRFLLSFCDN